MTPKGYDAFAQDFFAPIFPSYAQKIIDRTGVTTGKILDLGSGGGHLGFALMDLGNFESVTFFDTQEKALDNARERAEALMYSSDACYYEQGDACDLSRFEEGAFNLVVSRGSMHFWSDCEAALRGIHRILAPGGYCYIGGGVGVTNRQTDRMDAIMERMANEYGVGHGGDPKIASEKRKNDRTRQCKEFADLFHELNCSYALINSKAEGGWFIFCKDDELQVW